MHVLDAIVHAQLLAETNVVDVEAIVLYIVEDVEISVLALVIVVLVLVTMVVTVDAVDIAIQDVMIHVIKAVLLGVQTSALDVKHHAGEAVLDLHVEKLDAQVVLGNVKCVMETVKRVAIHLVIDNVVIVNQVVKEIVTNHVH